MSFRPFDPEATLDPAAIELLRRTAGLDLAVRQVEYFNNESTRLLDSARSAIGANDGACAHDALRALRAVSNQVGAHGVAFLCSAGANLARGGQLGDCQMLLDRISAEREAERSSMVAFLLGQK